MFKSLLLQIAVDLTEAWASFCESHLPYMVMCSYQTVIAKVSEVYSVLSCTTKGEAERQSGGMCKSESIIVAS